MNKYEIIGIVGEGAYGIVYKAKCKETGEFGKSAKHTQSLSFTIASLSTMPSLLDNLYSIDK